MEITYPILTQSEKKTYPNWDNVAATVTNEIFSVKLWVITFSIYSVLLIQPILCCQWCLFMFLVTRYNLNNNVKAKIIMLQTQLAMLDGLNLKLSIGRFFLVGLMAEPTN
jgi:hypothetical protein